MKKLTMLLSLIILLASPAWGQGGPIVLMGLDAEDCGPPGFSPRGDHGPISIYQAVASSILSQVTKPGASGIIVLGGTSECIQPFWSALASGIGQSITFVSGSDLSTVSFTPFALIGIASDSFNTPGGLTDTENNLLAGRTTDIATHVDSGGGILGFSNCALLNPYLYLGGIGAFACGSVRRSDITPTPEGSAVGITDDLDVCCWHDSYTSFPSFLKVLATYVSEPGNPPATIGGAQVVICPVTTVLEEDPNKKTKLDLLRQFRDEVLRASPEGDHYVRLFYAHAAEASWLLLRHPELYFQSQALIDRLLPVAQARLAGEQAVVRQADLKEVEALLEAFTVYGSPELQADIQTMQAELQQGGVLEQFGIVVR